MAKTGEEAMICSGSSQSETFSADDSVIWIQNGFLGICFFRSEMKRKRNGAPTGTRTRDPMIKSHLLYQLSYGRICDNLSLGMRLIYTGSRKMQMTFAKKIRFFCFLRFSERRNSR